MGDVTDFPTSRFRIVPPARRLDLSERVAAAYDVIGRAEAALRLGNDPDSGFRLLMRAAAISISRGSGAGAARAYVAELLNEVEQSGGSAA